jgi:BirA family biotin operon repressor/biotin-[acetyl-CoA-carboxylase] ligase
LRPQFEQKLWPLITLMSAVVVNEALLEACGLETDIKWPNDILYEEKKLCGILAEIVETPGGRAVVVGIGINLTNDSFPIQLATVATSVAAATGRDPVLDQVLDRLQQSFARWYRKLSQQQSDIILAWSQRSSYANGKRVRITDNGTQVEGTTRGLDLEGGLRLETETGEIKIIRAGDVTVRPLATN